VLFFASPFFEAALSGDWAETHPGRPLSMSSIITISQPPSVPGDKSKTEAPTEMTFAPIEGDHDNDELNFSDAAGVASESEDENYRKATNIDESLKKLESGSQRDSKPSPDTHSRKSSGHKIPGLQATIKRRRKANRPDAVIVLKEEKVCFLL
jgi:hypothetical protein